MTVVKKKYVFTPAFWKQDCVVGTENGSTKQIGFMRFWIHKPSKSFNDYGLFLSASCNGKAATLKIGKSDIDTIILALGVMKKTLEANEAQFASETALIRTQNEAYEAMAGMKTDSEVEADLLNDDVDDTGVDPTESGFKLTPELIAQAMPLIKQFMATNQGVKPPVEAPK